jgi:MFS family permease
MRWPYNARVDSALAWGVLGSGIAIGGAIVGALTGLHGNERHFHWWWPTNWMIVPAVLVLIGLIMVVMPLHRHDDQRKESPQKPPESPQIPQTIRQDIIAEAPGSTAQGAVHGNVINYATPPGDGPTDPPAIKSADNRP